jgi:hypothetical protein
MSRKCKKCGKEFEGREPKEFCSLKCEENYLNILRKKLDDIIRNDPGHTKNLSEL